MDRRSKQKITASLVVFGLLLLFVAAAFFLMGKNTKVSEKQVKELMVLYPLSGQELLENFDYYDGIRRRNVFGAFLGVAAVFSLFCILFWFWEKRRIRKQWEGYRKNLLAASGQLLRFQKGEFEVTQKPPLDLDAMEWEDDWKGFWEGMKELGLYFSVLKERMLQEENSTKSLITDISHQLKTPLAAIRMNYEMAREEGLTKEEREEFICREKRQIDVMEVLLEELVKLSRLESRMIELNRQQIELQALLQNAINQIFMKAHRKGIELQADIQKDIFVSVDAKWTAEAFVNVLDNGVKYSPAHSEISLRTKKLETQVLIEVEDEGMGVSQEEMHRIFGRFYRGREARRLEEEGAGVGLYLARKILEEQGGTIAVKRKQVGSIFRITLPLV